MTLLQPPGNWCQMRTVLICEQGAQEAHPRTMPDFSPTPLCTLPCSVRFTVWCLRVARMSVEGSPAARNRLREIDDFLQMSHAAGALERWVMLLKDDALQPLDIREFGCVYLSRAEVDLVAALGWLQEGDVAGAQRVMAHYTGVSRLPSVMQAATLWIQSLKTAGVVLPHFEDLSGSQTSRAVTEEIPTLH